MSCDKCNKPNPPVKYKIRIFVTGIVPRKSKGVL